MKRLLWFVAAAFSVSSIFGDMNVIRPYPTLDDLKGTVRNRYPLERWPVGTLQDQATYWVVIGTGFTPASLASGNTQFLSVGSATIAGYDEGLFIINMGTINCVGAGITCTGSGQGGVFTITVTGGGGGGGGGGAAFVVPGGITVSSWTFPLGEFAVVGDGVTGATITYRSSTGTWSASEQSASTWTFSTLVVFSTAVNINRSLIIGTSDYSLGVTTGIYLCASPVINNTTRSSPELKFFTGSDVNAGPGITEVISSFTINMVTDSTSQPGLKQTRLRIQNVDGSEIYSVGHFGLYIRQPLATGDNTDVFAVGTTSFVVDREGLVKIGNVTYQTHNSTTDARFNAVATDTTTLGTSTGTLAAKDSAIVVDTTTLGTSTGTLAARISAISIDTTTLGTSTGTLQASISNLTQGAGIWASSNTNRSVISGGNTNAGVIAATMTTLDFNLYPKSGATNYIQNTDVVQLSTYTVSSGTVQGNLVVVGSATVEGVLTATGGFVTASATAAYFSVGQATIATSGGTQFWVFPASGMAQGQHLIVTSKTGAYHYLAGGGDNAGSGGGGGGGGGAALRVSTNTSSFEFTGSTIHLISNASFYATTWGQNGASITIKVPIEINFNAFSAKLTTGGPGNFGSTIDGGTYTWRLGFSSGFPSAVTWDGMMSPMYNGEQLYFDFVWFSTDTSNSNLNAVVWQTEFWREAYSVNETTPSYAAAVSSTVGLGNAGFPIRTVIAVTAPGIKANESFTIKLDRLVDNASDNSPVTAWVRRARLTNGYYLP